MMIWVTLAGLAVLGIGAAVVILLWLSLDKVVAQSGGGALRLQLGELESQRRSARNALFRLRLDAFKRAVAAHGRTLTWAFWSVCVVGLIVTVAYSLFRPMPPASATLVGNGPAASGTHPGGDVAAMVSALEARLKQNPDSAEGWRMLGWSYMQTGRYADAARAYGAAARLTPDRAEYWSAQGEALARAADGQVSDTAQAAFLQALKADPADPRARYFLALRKDQTGDHAGALKDWGSLLKDAPADAPWLPDVRAFVERAAAAHGGALDLPRQDPKGALPQEAVRGPTPEQIGQAAQLAPTEQQAMINGMVDRLAARLAAQPRDAEGWVNLMRARMVLGQSSAAAAAYQSALKAFGDDKTTRTQLTQSARGLSVPGS